MLVIVDKMKYFAWISFYLLLFGNAQSQTHVSAERKLMQEGDGYLDACQYVEALDSYQRGIEVAMNKDSAHLLAEFYTSAGIVYDYLGDYHSALGYYETAFRLMDSLGDQRWKAAILNNIGALFVSWNKHEVALGFFKKSLIIEQSIKNNKGIAESLQNIGISFRNTGQTDSAMWYYEKSLALSIDLKDSIMISTSYDNIGYVFLDQGDANQAMRWFQKALDIQRAIDDRLGIVYSLNNLGLAARILNDVSKSESFFRESITEARKSGLNKEALVAWENIVSISESKGDFQGALAAMKEVIFLRDTLFNEMSTRKMAEMEARFELNNKNKELTIRQLTIDQQDADLQRGRVIRISIIVALMLSIAIAVFLMYLYRQKKAAYQVLLLQNIELARQEKLLKEHDLVSPLVYGQEPPDELPAEEKYIKSSLTQEQKEEINIKLLHLMEKEQIFLRSDLSVEQLAEEAGTNRRYLSQVINEIHQTNFNTFINTFRVREARKLLLDPSYRQYSLEGIASAAGFNSRISFNNAFKKITGLTPAYFQRINQ